MTEEQAAGLKRSRSIAWAGAGVAAVGLVTGIPTAIAGGLLACWGGVFILLIGYLDTAS